MRLSWPIRSRSGSDARTGSYRPATQDLDLAAVREPAQVRDECRALGAKPFQQRTGVVQPDANLRVALQRLDHRAVGLLEHISKDPAEVADRLVVVERQRKRDSPRHDGCASTLRSTSIPAAGRYSCSVYSWSILVVENCHRVVAIDRRMRSTQRPGTPAASRS